MHDLDSSHIGTNRRRSERIPQSIPIIVRGIDLLGQPFEERSSTLSVNLQGCRYASKYHLPKNTWVTLEVVRGTERANVRARVAWIQRPRSIRELFQIAVELESPGNFWAIENPPADWQSPTTNAYSAAASQVESGASREEFSGEGNRSTASSGAEGKISEMTQGPSESGIASESVVGRDTTAAADSPLLREWRVEVEHRAAAAVEKAAEKAIEQIRVKLEEFERDRDNEGAALASELATGRENLLSELRAEIDRDFRGVRDLVQDLDRKAEGLRAESQAALESISRLAQARLQTEAAQLQKPSEPPPGADLERSAAEMRAQLESEMELAKAQWSELLQSSLDGGVERLVKELSGRSQEILRDADQKISERLADLRQPLAQLSSTAQETLASVKSALDQDLERARASLADIEHSASRTKEYSAQLESATHDTLNELHGRLENILQAQSDEMKRRAESLVASMQERVRPSLDTLGQQVAERTVADIDSKIAPRLERVSESLRELAARESQAEESLRLHRERLRQISEANQREASSQMAVTLANVRGEFETARKESLAKWNEELDAAGVRAAHAAAESIGRSSEWFQQEARSRLQVLVEQSVGTADTTLDEKIEETAKKFEAQLEERAKVRVADAEQSLEALAGELTGRTRSQLDEAAEAAASSFGQVIREVSDREVRKFADESRGALAKRSGELENLTRERLEKFNADSGASMEQLRAQMASELDARVTSGRDLLAAEFAKAADGFRAERESREAAWAETAGRLGDEAAAKFQERLQTVSDSWALSAMRKLNERGQTAVESLLHSADQALRDSFARVFEGLSEALREHTSGGGSSQGHNTGLTPPENSERPMPPPPAEGASNSANA